VNELDEVAERIQGFLKMETPQGFFDSQMLPKLAELDRLSKSVNGACKEVIQKEATSTFLISYSEMLAAGWRAVHYVSTGVYKESGNWEKKCRDVPHAGFDERRPDALATQKHGAEHFRRARAKIRRQNSRERGDGAIFDGAGGDAADSAGPRTMMFAGFCDASQWKWCLRDERSGSTRNAESCWRVTSI